MKNLFIVFIAFSLTTCYAQAPKLTDWHGTSKTFWQVGVNGAQFKFSADSNHYYIKYPKIGGGYDSLRIVGSKNPRGNNVWFDIFGWKWFKTKVRVDTLDINKFFKLGDSLGIAEGSLAYSSLADLPVFRNVGGDEDTIPTVEWLGAKGKIKNLKGGGVYSLPYQKKADSTLFFNPATADTNKLLQFYSGGWRLSSTSTIIDSTIWAKKSYVDSLFLLTMGNYWEISGQYVLLDSTSRILDLRNNKMHLPTSLDDEGMLGFSGNKVVYFDNVGTKNLASENWVINYVNTSGIAPDTLDYPLFRNNSNHVELLYDDPFYVDGYNGALKITIADSTHAGILTATKYAQIMAGLGSNLIDDNSTTSTTKTWSAYKIFTEVDAVNDDLETAITGYNTSGSIYQVHWNNLTNKPSFYSLPSGATSGSYSLLNEVGEEVILSFTDGIFTGQSSGSVTIWDTIADMIADAIAQHVIDAH